MVEACVRVQAPYEAVAYIAKSPVSPERRRWLLQICRQAPDLTPNLMERAFQQKDTSTVQEIITLLQQWQRQGLHQLLPLLHSEVEMGTGEAPALVPETLKKAEQMLATLTKK